MERRKSGEVSESGFTLIELLIVIVVLGILAAIVVFSLTGVSGQSKQAACTSDGKTVEIAADAYQASKGTYPDTGATGQSELVGTYLHSWPGTGNGYTISIGANTINVDPGNGTAVPYTSTAGCALVK
jgi:general secretion pathway protein G